MFHYKDGLFFGRNEDGSVKIRKMRDATGAAALVAEMDIDPDGWASIVASVSVEGDTAEAFNAVLEFHKEGILRSLAEPDARLEALAAQIDILAQFILKEVPGEPSENEGAVDTAIRLIRRSLAPINPEPVPDEVFEAPETIESPPPGAELEQPTEAPPYEAEAPPEQPTEGEGKSPEGA